MIVIQLSNASLVLGAQPIFTNLNWSIQHDQKIGLIGANGAGKSSIFKLIMGEHSPEPGGLVVKAKGISLGYLAQQPELAPNDSTFTAALHGNPRWAELAGELVRIENSLSDPEVYNDSKALARALDAQQKYLEEYLALGGDDYPQQVGEILAGLGLAKEDFDKPVSKLSGGQKKLVGLARLLLAKPDVVLLDEPDNHLDLAGKAFLEGLINDYSGAVVIVSHDRYLLDSVVTHIAELEDGKIYTFKGDYSSYVIDKETRMARAEELYQVQQREIVRLEMALKRYALWVQRSDKFTSRMHAMEARLARIEKRERPVLERRRMGLELNGWRGSNKVLELIGVEKSFQEQPVLLGIDALIRHGERVGLIGANGAGKSVLLRLVLGREKADAGEIKIGPSVKIGYYAQEHETLDPEQTLIDAVRRGIPAGGSMSEANAVAFLNRYLFPYRMVTLPIRELSGGERSRLQLALLVLSGANFLLLDEPTNNLDIASAEVLENALEDFEGTVLVISHDRYFLDRTVNRILLLDDGELVEFEGGYSDYAQKIAYQSM
ncbi:MAG: ABC-F family ATP-binding cassette domain-containing protein [Anaerolineales bacterium]|jgi:ATP-binding cassette subfamily F protein 3